MKRLLLLATLVAATAAAQPINTGQRLDVGRLTPATVERCQQAGGCYVLTDDEMLAGLRAANRVGERGRRNQWILTYVSRGAIVTSGKKMFLEECTWQGRDLGGDATHITCINAHDPSCRVYRDLTGFRDQEKRCRTRFRADEMVTE